MEGERPREPVPVALELLLQDKSNFHQDAVFDDFAVVDDDFLLGDPGALDVLKGFVGAGDALVYRIVEAFG
jgi:hypothetical protein